MIPQALRRILALLVVGALALAGPLPAYALRDLQVTQSEAGLEELADQMRGIPTRTELSVSPAAGTEERPQSEPSEIALIRTVIEGPLAIDGDPSAIHSAPPAMLQQAGSAFLFSRPLPLTAIESLLDRQDREHLVIGLQFPGSSYLLVTIGTANYVKSPAKRLWELASAQHISLGILDIHSHPGGLLLPSSGDFPQPADMVSLAFIKRRHFIHDGLNHRFIEYGFRRSRFPRWRNLTKNNVRFPPGLPARGSLPLRSSHHGRGLVYG